MSDMDYLDQFNSIMGEIVPGGMARWLDMNGYFDAPASTKYHGNFLGGLFYHSIAVTDALLDITENMELEWKREESPWIVGMFHDLCKMDEYETDDNGLYVRNKDTLYQGHGDKSVMLLASWIQLTEEEVACIRYHMGAFTDKAEWGCYTKAVAKYPNVLWTHTADMIASQVKGL